MRRKLSNAVCTASSGCDNGAGRAPYYESVGHAYGAIDSRLLNFNHRINPEDWADKTNGLDFSDGNVSFNVEVWDGYNSHTEDLAVNLYRMPSGRYELTVYVA
jgi:hypothetical protein